MSEIRVRVDIEDNFNNDFTCEVSSSNRLSIMGSSEVQSQIELARLMGEAFRVLSHHLVAPPSDQLILQTFALAALDSELEFPE
jgi:hypothetical protein